jgi:transcriptional regulator with XRE-family HTH domain
MSNMRDFHFDGAAIARARIRKGLTVRGAAKMAGLGFANWSRVERSHVAPSLETLYRMATTLEMKALVRALEGFNAKG